MENTQEIGRATPAYLFGKVAKICWDYPTIIYGDKTFTWKDFDERSNQLANALLDMGVGKQERIGIFSLSNNEFLEYIWASWKINAIPMLSSLTPQYPLEDVEVLINRTDIKTLFVLEDFIERIEKIRPDLKKVKNYIVIGEKEDVPDGMHHYETLINKYPKTRPQFDWNPQQDDDIPGTLFSAGTTGVPKIIDWECKPLFLSGTVEILQICVKDAIPRLIKDAPQSIFEKLSKIFSPPFDKIFLDLVDLRDFNPSLLISLLKPISELPLDIISEIMPYFTGGTFSSICPNPQWVSWACVPQIISFLLGGCVVIPSKTLNPFCDPHEALELVDKYKIKCLAPVMDMAGGNQILDALDEKPDRYSLDSLAFILTGPVFDPKKFRKRLMEHKQILAYDGIISSDCYFTAGALYFSPDDKECSEPIYDLNPHIRLVNEEYREVKTGEYGRTIKDPDWSPVKYYGEGMKIRPGKLLQRLMEKDGI